MAFQPQCKLGENTQACTDDLKLCIQVTGYGQDQENQKMYFYQEDLTTPIQEKADEIVTQQALGIDLSMYSVVPDCPSTLFNWNKNKVANLKLGLQIKKAKGGYIHLPVADQITSNTQKDQGNQYKSNHFLAFVPLAVSDLPRDYFNYLTQSNSQENHSQLRRRANMPTTVSEVLYAPAREGYLYIFFNHRLWREVKIEQDSKGKNSYKDIDVRAFRQNNGEGVFIEEKDLNGQPKTKLIREAEGEALDNIWLPYRLSDKETAINLIYCEDQISPERLNVMEESTAGKVTTLRSRNDICLAKTLVTTKSFELDTRPFRMDFLPTTRGRNLAVEWKLFYPATYLTDISDQALTRKYNSTKTLDESCTREKAPDSNVILSDFNNITGGAFREFEISAWQEILANQSNATDTIKETIWSSHKPTPTEDVLADYKNRYIIGIPLIDPMNELHHRHMLLTMAQNTELFKCLAARTKQADKDEIGHFITNAAYVHEDLRKTIKKLPKQVAHNYNRSIANAERSYLLNRIEQWQNEITTILKSKSTEIAITNLLSNHLTPVKYAINMQVIANCLQRISKAPVAYDPMLSTLSAEATNGQVFIYQLANSPKMPLHKMLWPIVDFEELTKDAPEQYQYQPNKGDGAFSAHTIIAAGELDKIDPKLLDPIKAELFNIQIQTQYESNLELLKNELKAGYAGLYGLFSVLVSAVDEASAKRRELATAVKLTNSENSAYKAAQTTADQSASSAEAAERSHQESVKQGEQLTAKQQQLDERIVFDRKRLAMLGVNEQALLNQLPTNFKGETFLPFIKQLRMIPVFKDIGYILPSQISTKMVALGLYTQGNLEALEKLFIEFYGARAKGQLTLWNKFRQLLAKAGIDIANAAIDIKDWVLGMKVSEIRQRRQVLAVFAHRLELTFNHLLETVELKNLQAANIKETLRRQGVMDALKAVAEQDSKAAAAARQRLNQALISVGEKQAALNGVANYSPTAEKYQAFLKSPMLPGALMMIEAWNVFSIYKQYDDFAIKRGDERAEWGKRSALWDGGLAVLLFVERLEIQKLQFLGKTFNHITWVRNIGLGKTNALGVINFAAMAITAGICFWDAAYYYDRNNPAWIGYAMAGVGASMLALQALLPALITPMGWFVVGVGLLIIGLGLASYLDNSDKIKEWFIQGPYRQQVNENYNHLQSSEEALYRLLSILLYFAVEIQKIDKAAVEAKWQQFTNAPINETEEQKALRQRQLALYNKAKQADIQVSVKCLCANFLTACQYIPKLARYEKQTSTGLGPFAMTSYSVTLKEQISLNQLEEMIEYTDMGIDLYLKVNKQIRGLIPVFSEDIWVFKMQIIAQPLDKTLGDTLRIFPAPKLEYKEPYNDQKDSIAIFKQQDRGTFSVDTSSDQPFWFETEIRG